MNKIARIVALGAVVVGGLLSGCATQQRAAEPPKPPTLRSWDTFEPDSEAARAYLGGQPSVEALEAFKAAGGTTVVNMRTESEMERLPYYAATVEGLGLEYVHVPTPGSELGTSHRDAVNAAMARADGPVLLHCGSGTRAIYAWGGHMMSEAGWSVDEAKAWCTARRDGEVSEGGNAALDRMAAGE